MAEDWTGLTKPSKRLVKSYKLIYSPDPLPKPIYPAAPAPERTSSNTSTTFGSAFAVAKPTAPPPYRILKTIAPNTEFQWGGGAAGETRMVNSGSSGAVIYVDSSGNVGYAYK